MNQVKPPIEPRGLDILNMLIAYYSLSGNEQYCIRQRLLHKAYFKEIGEDLGISESGAYNMFDRAIEKIKKSV